jgi:hypothetical protein
MTYLFLNHNSRYIERGPSNVSLCTFVPCLLFVRTITFFKSTAYYVISCRFERTKCLKLKNKIIINNNNNNEGKMHFTFLKFHPICNLASGI